MTKQLSDVQKISCTTAKIQDAPGTRQIEFDLANPSNVNSNPTVEIEIFWPVRAGIRDRVTLANLCESNWIDCFDDPLFSKREPTGSEKPERVLPRADQAPAVYKFSNLMSKLHLKKDHTL